MSQSATLRNHVLSEQNNEELPDETVEELEALLVQEKTKLDEAWQKAKLISLKEKLKELQKETLAEQCKLHRDMGSGKTGSKKVARKNKLKDISSRDLREFEDLSQAVEKCLSTMGLPSSASATVADESTSSEESDHERNEVSGI